MKINFEDVKKGKVKIKSIYLEKKGNPNLPKNYSIILDFMGATIKGGNCIPISELDDFIKKSEQIETEDQIIYYQKDDKDHFESIIHELTRLLPNECWHIIINVGMKSDVNIFYINFENILYQISCYMNGSEKFDWFEFDDNEEFFVAEEERKDISLEEMVKILREKFEVLPSD